jgi:hypothetical protein
MPFIFANASALGLLPIAAMPVIFHLFFRLRKQVHDFPTLIFFLRIDPRLSAKRKIHEWLILLLRTLLICAVIFALARPSTGLVNSQSGVARIIIIDNSGSMGESTQPGLTKLRLACQSAQTLIANKQPGDSVAVQLMIPDPLSALPAGFEASSETVRTELEKLDPTDSAPSLPRALRRAFATLKTAKQSIFEIHLVTDLQTQNWTGEPLGSLGGQARIVVHRIETEPVHGGAVSLEITDAPTRSIPVGRIVPVKFTLTNRAKEKAHVRLNSADDNGKNSTQDFTLDESQTISATLTFTFNNPGLHWANIWIDGDTAASSTHGTVGFWCTEVAQAILVGDRHDFGALPYAVAPGGSPELSGIETKFIEPGKLTDSLSQPIQPLAVVVNWDNWPNCPVLENYVESGGTLFILPSTKMGTIIGPPIPAWLKVVTNPMPKIPDAGESIIPLQSDDAIWRDLRDPQGAPKLGLLLAFHELPLKMEKNWVVLLASAHGANLLGRCNLGRGKIYASGLAFLPLWSSLPLKGAFVVLMQNAFFGRTKEQIPVILNSAGDDVPFESATNFTTIRSLAGSPVSWQGQPEQFAGLPRSGVYEIVQGTKSRWVATHGNPDETVPDFLPIGPIPLLQNLAPDIVPLSRPEDVLIDPKRHASGTPLYGYALLAALLLIFLETWIANEGSVGFSRKKTSKYART